MEAMAERLKRPFPFPTPLGTNIKKLRSDDESSSGRAGSAARPNAVKGQGNVLMMKNELYMSYLKHEDRDQHKEKSLHVFVTFNPVLFAEKGFIRIGNAKVARE
jgi:hypothetical protein